MFLYIGGGGNKKSSTMLNFQLRDFFVLLYFVVVSIVIGIIFFFFVNISSFFSLKLSERSCSFECGYLALDDNRLFFSIQFFLFSLIFLLFDVEVSFVLPVSFFLSDFFYCVLSVSFFLVIIFICSYFE